MDKGSPNHHLLDIESEIKRCQGELAELSQIIDEVEGDLGRLSLDNLTRSDQQPKNHDQAITLYNKLVMKLHKLNSQAISHPIHRLPLELLEHIFHMLFEIESPYNGEFPLNLTQVCSQWESLVSSVRNRSLWSTVLIDPVNPDWLERLHLHLFLSRDEGLDIHITEMTQSIVDELAGHHRRIRSLPPTFMISQIWDSTTSEPDIIQVVISRRPGGKPFAIPLSSSVTALPVVDLGEGSLHRLQSFLQLRVLDIVTQAPQLLELGGRLQLPALQELLLQTRENPLEVLRIFATSQLVDLHMDLLGSLSAAAYYELETFIIGHMPNLRSVVLLISDYDDSVFVQPVEEPTTQSSSARQSESLRRIDCIVQPFLKDNPPFERLIESAPHLEECSLVSPVKSLPCFSHHIRKLEFNFYDSPILLVVNGGLFKLTHLEVLRLIFTTAEQLQLLTLLQAPSLLSLEVSYISRGDPQGLSIPLDAIVTFISNSQGICKLLLDLGFSVGGMSLSLPKLRNLKISNVSHVFLLANFDVPKLQHLYLEIDDGRREDEFVAEGKDFAEDQIGIASPTPASEAAGRLNVLDMMNTRQILEIGKRSILEEDHNGAEMNRLKDTNPREVPFDPVMICAPTFSALTFEHLKDFEFWVLSAYDSHQIRTFPNTFTAFPALPYFSDLFTALPALERVTLPAVYFNNTPYIDQMVKKLSENPTLCPNLQEIRTCEYPNEWSNLLKFLRDRKRASILSNTVLRPIHALHFPITPHGSIIEQLQDAMLGKVSIKPFSALCPWPLIDSTLVRIGSSRGTGTGVNSDEVTRSPRQDGDEWTAAMRVQAQEEDITGNSDKGRQNKEQSGCGENEDEVLSCFCCHKAGLVAGCCRVRTRGIISKMNVSSGDVRCSRWDTVMQRKTKFEVICSP